MEPIHTSIEISPLDGTQNALSSHKGERKASLPPKIRRLPPEILTIIFEFCVDKSTLTFISPKESPILLTYVCREWRNIARSTSNLWTQIHIDWEAMKHPLLISFLECHIGYSKTRPLEIVLDLIHFPTGIYSVQTRSMFEIARILNPNYPRSRHSELQIYNDYRVAEAFFPQETSFEMPVLELIALSDVLGDTLRLSKLRFEAPHLECIWLKRLSFGSWKWDQLFPLMTTSVQCLNVMGLETSVAALCSALEQLPSLTDCTIRFLSLAIPLRSSTLVMSMLQRLCFVWQMNEGPEAANLQSILDIINAPLLKELTLICEGHEGDTLTDGLDSASWWENILPTLQRLKLEGIDLGYDFVERFMPWCASLERLEIYNCLMWEQIVRLYMKAARVSMQNRTPGSYTPPSNLILELTEWYEDVMFQNVSREELQEMKVVAMESGILESVEFRLND